MSIGASEEPTNVQRTDADTGSGRTSVPPTGEWRVKHLVRRLVTGGAEGCCASCRAPLADGWFDVVFQHGGWDVGEETAGSFCTEDCVEDWLDERSSVICR